MKQTGDKELGIQTTLEGVFKKEGKSGKSHVQLQKGCLNLFLNPLKGASKSSGK
jgi:hypothetical protein